MTSIVQPILQLGHQWFFGLLPEALGGDLTNAVKQARSSFSCRSDFAKVGFWGLGPFQETSPHTFPITVIMLREYPVEATSVEGFVQQVVQYITHGYRYFVTGQVPAGKDPRSVDGKLLERYSVQATKWTRARRKQQGQANLRYLRHGRFFVILATPGRHPFFELERAVIKDVREVPIKHAGYSISYRPGGRHRDGSSDLKYRAHVRIETKRYRELKAYLVDMATRRTAEKLAAEFWSVPFEPYAPIRRQLLNILRAVNRVRQAAGYEKLRYSVLRYKRRIVRPFGEAAFDKAA